LDWELRPGWVAVIGAGLLGAELVDTDPELGVTRSINFSGIKMFFTAYVLCSLRLFKLRRPNNISRNPHCQVKKKSNQNSHLSWVSF